VQSSAQGASSHFLRKIFIDGRKLGFGILGKNKPPSKPISSFF
jgi:hypothetical protein